jgi:hypothetical protein
MINGDVHMSTNLAMSGRVSVPDIIPARPDCWCPGRTCKPDPINVGFAERALKDTNPIR